MVYSLLFGGTQRCWAISQSAGAEAPGFTSFTSKTVPKLGYTSAATANSPSGCFPKRASISSRHTVVCFCMHCALISAEVSEKGQLGRAIPQELLVESFVHFSVQLSICASIHPSFSFVHSLIPLCAHSFLCVIYSFFHSYAHSFNCKPSHSFTFSTIHLRT